MKKILVLFLAIGFLLDFGLAKVLAATGVITGGNSFAWGENIGWVNFLASGGDITITDTSLTGYAWNSNYGWINLSPSTSGVTNNCSGTLGGYAWSSTLGWIDFTGATINSSGKFTGIIGTSSSTPGRITFDCSNCDVETDWRPSCSITPTPTPTTAPTPTPTSAPSSSSSSTTSGGWAAPACTATKPASAPTITNTVSGENSVTLTWSKAGNPVTKYLIAYGTKSGSIEFGNPNVGNENTTSYTIKGLSGGTKYYFKVKAINDCTPGDWSNEMSAIAKGKLITTTTTNTGAGTTITTTEPATNFVPASELPSQLFDIALIVDQTQINNASDLNARVTFISFGRENTPVEMTFTIIDENGKEYYRSNDKTIIQTEGVFNKTFKELILAKGKYTLVLNTLYNTNIRDEFKQGFEVGGVETTTLNSFLSNKPLITTIGVGVIFILILWIILLMKRRKKKEEIRM